MGTCEKEDECMKSLVMQITDQEIRMIQAEKEQRRLVRALTIISVTQHTSANDGQKWCQEIADAALLGETHQDLTLEA